MRIHRSVFRIALALVVAALLTAPGLADAQTKLVLGHSTPTTDPCHQSALIFAKEFEKLTKGKYVVEVYPADHGWCVPGSQAYDEPSAERAWGELLKLYKANLV